MRLKAGEWWSPERVEVKANDEAWSRNGPAGNSNVPQTCVRGTDVLVWTFRLVQASLNVSVNASVNVSVNGGLSRE